jgi:hypothetical protein
MNNKRTPGKGFSVRILLGVVMLITAIIAGIFVLPKVAQTSTATYTVYTLADDISAGSVLAEDDIVAASTTDAQLASIAPSAAAEIIGKKAARDLTKGMYVYTSDLTTGQILSNSSVPAGKQIVSIPVSSLAMSVSYQVQTNDIIRIYALSDTKKAYAPAALQYVQIYGVYDENGNDPHATGLHPVNISFILDQTQAEELVTLINTRGIHLSLLSRNDEAYAKAALEKQAEIIEKLVKESEKNS